jgi:hypothetical protein
MSSRPAQSLLLSALYIASMTGLWVVYSVLCTASSVAPLDGVNVLWSLGMGILVVWWVRTDTHPSKYSPCFDYGTFMMAWWPVLLPHYLVRTRGFKGLLIYAGLVGFLLILVVVVALATAAIGL